MIALRVAGSGAELAFAPRRLVIAGYTGSDAAAVAAHIAELAAIGVPPPPSVPTFYELDPALLTTDPVIAAPGRATSGEVEPVLLRHSGRWFLAVGSDHTDRDREREDVAAAKAACPKPIGPVVAELGPDPSTPDWDRIDAGSTVDETPYQNGFLAALRRPADVLARLGDVPGDLALFGGTLPLPPGGFTFGTHWNVRLALPGGPTLTHDYRITPRSTG